VQLHLDTGVTIRLTLTLAEAQRMLAQLQRAVDYHTGPAR